MFAVAHGFFDAGNGETHGGLKGIGERLLFCDRPAEGACENIACPVELHVEIFAVIRTEFSGRAVVCHDSLTRAVGDYSGQNRDPAAEPGQLYKDILYNALVMRGFFERYSEHECRLGEVRNDYIGFPAQLCHTGGKFFAEAGIQLSVVTHNGIDQLHGTSAEIAEYLSDDFQLFRNGDSGDCLVLGSGVFGDVKKQLRWRACHPLTDAQNHGGVETVCGMIFYGLTNADAAAELLEARGRKKIA